MGSGVGLGGVELRDHCHVCCINVIAHIAWLVFTKSIGLGGVQTSIYINTD